MLLRWMPIPGWWQGTYHQGTDQYTLFFDHDPVTGITTPGADWDIDFHHNWGNYETKTIPLHPNLYYESWIIIPTFFRWRTQLIVTS